MTKVMRRRDLLGGLAAIGPLTAAGRVWAAPATDARLLVVFLRGAYDAANVVIPVSSDFYYQSRPTLAVPRPGSGSPTAALALDGDWGLHPALKDSLYPLWQAKQVAFIPFAGTDDLTRSHFETQDTIELGQSIQGTRDYRSGFLGRLAGVLTQGHPIAFTDQLPLSFRGGAPIPNIGLNAVGKPGVDDRQARLIADMYKNRPLATSVAEGFQVRDDVYNSISQQMLNANRGAVSPKGFELSARRVGRLMREQFNLGFVDVGGWDTHVNQGGNGAGYLSDRIGELGRGLAGFNEEIGPAAWRDTVVVVISEFGRTFRENGDKGTDHGHGSVYWVLGGQVKGGAYRRPAGSRRAGQPVSESRLPGAHRLPRAIRRLVPTDLRAFAGAAGNRVPEHRAEGSFGGLNRLRAGVSQSGEHPEGSRAMRICVYGAGATGGHFAVALALAGHQVSVIARGPHLAAIQAKGLTLLAGETSRNARVAASDDPGKLGAQDLVMVMVKATGLAPVAAGLAPLIGPETTVLFPQNGMTWWYRTGLSPAHPTPPDIPVFSMAERFLAYLRPDQVLGGTIYSSNEVIEPGVVRNASAARNALNVGAIAPGATQAPAVRAALEAAGIISPPIADIRSAMWQKLMMNMSGSTVALATETLSSVSRTDPSLAEIYTRVANEGLAIAGAHGYPLDGIVVPERMLASLVDHRPSLLQDYLAGRPMEVAEMIGAPVAFARAAGLATPTLDVLAAIITRRARDRGLLPPAAQRE